MDASGRDISQAKDFIARLAALVPKPRAHLTRYHGVFAPASPDRAQIVPSAGAVAERSEAAAIDRHDLPAKVLENPLNDRRRFDAGNDA